MPTSFGLLTGQRIVLIGASGDLGRAMTTRLLAEGARVMATANRHPERLDAVAGTGTTLTTVQLDVTDDGAIEAAATEAAKAGPLDAVIYNAGVTRDGPVLGLEDEDWQAVMTVNLQGAFRVARHFGKLLFRQRRGRLLFVSSVAGQKGGRGQANYAASKAGLEALVRSLAAEMAPRGVLVNAIAPGPVESKMTADVMREAGAEVLRHIALGRLAQPDEIAAVAAHLLAPDMTYITGQTIAIDGGFGR